MEHAVADARADRTIVVEALLSGESVRMAIAFDPMHDEEFTRMAAMGLASQLTMLDRRFRGQKA
jgi:hypothetical protein